MNKNPIVEFIKAAGAMNLSATDIKPLLKKALGQDVPEDQIQSVLGGAGGPPPAGGPQGSMQSSPAGGPGGPAGAPPGAGGPPGGGPGAADASAMIQALGAGAASGDPSGAGMGAPAGAPPGGGLIDPSELSALQQAHPQIDPMELQQIAEELAQYLASQDGGGSAGAPPQDGGGQDAIDNSADSGPEGAGGNVMPKQGSANNGLTLVKSAKYIEGFLGQAMSRGMNLPQAVNFYGDALNNTRDYIKQAEELEKISSTIDEKTAAYCQGIVEEANRRGYTYDQTVTLLKQSGVYEILLAEMDTK
jgi:hypothetical protein